MAQRTVGFRNFIPTILLCSMVEISRRQILHGSLYLNSVERIDQIKQNKHTGEKFEFSHETFFNSVHTQYRGLYRPKDEGVVTGVARQITVCKNRRILKHDLMSSSRVQALKFMAFVFVAVVRS
jgi:hypothetical protein